MQNKKVDYSVGVEYYFESYFKIIIGHSKNIRYGLGFLFNFETVEIQYGMGYQKLDKFLFHHGVDVVFNLNMESKWHKYIKP